MNRSKKLKSISIITEPRLNFSKTGYLINHLSKVWSNLGYKVRLSGKSLTPSADLAILHIDRTLVPVKHLVLSKKYPRVLNGDFTDNSKRLISKNILRQNLEYDGQVIVKTNANFGGFHELREKYKENIPQHVVADFSSHNSIMWPQIEHIPSDQYPVFESKTMVPLSIWNNPYLVVERFTPEIDAAGLYCMRGCLFFGDKEVNILVKSRSKVVKGRNILERKILAERAPDEVQQFKRDYNMDFGRIDYAIYKGKIVIFDANKTATLSNQASNEMYDSVVYPLALGIHYYE